MSESMKAAFPPRFRGPEAFDVRPLAAAPTGARQVRVGVHATAINPLDDQPRRGHYASCAPLPAVISHDISGAVLPLDRLAEGRKVLETGVRRRLRGKVAIDVSRKSATLAPSRVAAT